MTLRRQEEIFREFLAATSSSRNAELLVKNTRAMEPPLREVALKKMQARVAYVHRLRAREKKLELESKRLMREFRRTLVFEVAGLLVGPHEAAAIKQLLRKRTEYLKEALPSQHPFEVALGEAMRRANVFPEREYAKVVARMRQLQEVQDQLTAQTTHELGTDSD